MPSAIKLGCDRSRAPPHAPLKIERLQVRRKLLLVSASYSHEPRQGIWQEAHGLHSWRKEIGAPYAQPSRKKTASEGGNTLG